MESKSASVPVKCVRGYGILRVVGSPGRQHGVVVFEGHKSQLFSSLNKVWKAVEHDIPGYTVLHPTFFA